MDARRKIVIAHTDNTVRNAIAQLLQEDGYKNTRITSNLGDFLSGLRQAGCVILGKDMDFDAFQLARYIRCGQNGNDKNVPVILVVDSKTPTLELTAKLYQIDFIIEESHLDKLKSVLASVDSRRRSILIADDEEDTCNLIKRLFRSDYEVISANNGVEAYSLFKKHQFDVSVIDLMLPGIDGETLLERLLDQAPQHTALVFTAYKDEAIALRLLRKGGFHYMTKPSNPTEIRNAIQSAMQRSIFQKYTAYARKSLA
ncbi:MAG: hypothetical protein CMF25_01385 [Kangiellaceae bacterium]|nr:hypothetical protein [Kangiellaceae bacterium]|tara:strand:+ start:1146 stop:1916 length:771 start_codon:yes stop_codon:yes gene_type:complete